MIAAHQFSVSKSGTYVVRSGVLIACVPYCCRRHKYRFFFQAEDGIRDLTVTGVQTCALPIFGPGKPSSEQKHLVAERHGLQVVRGKIPVPDMRIEYEAHDGERARVDLELATKIGRASCRERV